MENLRNNLYKFVCISFILVIYHYISAISYYISGGIFMDYRIVVDAGHGGIG